MLLKMRITSAGKVGIGETAPLCAANGLHIKSGDSGQGTANVHADELVVEGSANSGINILSGASGYGSVFFGDSGDSNAGEITYNHSDNYMALASNGTEALRISTSQVLSTGGETAPDTTNGGITIDTNAEDGNVLTFKNSDVAHGITDQAQTDTYAMFTKLNAGSGGLYIKSFTEDVYGMYLQSTATNENTATSVNAIANIHLKPLLKSGTGGTGQGADANIFAIASANTKFIVKGDGDIYYDGADQGAYDSYDDAMLVRSWDLSHNKNVINSTFDKYVKYNHESLADAKLVGREEDGTPNYMVNITVCKDFTMVLFGNNMKNTRLHKRCINSLLNSR